MRNQRRRFLMGAAAASLAAATPAPADGTIPRRALGKTGLQVSLLGLGGARIGNLAEERDAVSVVKRCYDRGINYFDTAAAGAYGLSQQRYGIALAGVRDKVVLSTKTRHRTWTQAELDLNQSLASLKTDYLDLYQIHNVMNEEDIEFILGPRGVLEMVEKARKAGKIRFVGLTGHTDPAILNKLMGKYAFDTVLMPLGAVDGVEHQKSFEAHTLPEARAKGMGIIAMKTLGAGRVLEQKAATLDECLRYAFSLPISSAILGADTVERVEANVRIAAAFQPMTRSERAALRRRMEGFDMAGLQPWKQLPSSPAYNAD